MAISGHSKNLSNQINTIYIFLKESFPARIPGSLLREIISGGLRIYISVTTLVTRFEAAISQSYRLVASDSSSSSTASTEETSARTGGHCKTTKVSKLSGSKILLNYSYFTLGWWLNPVVYISLVC